MASDNNNYIWDDNFQKYASYTTFGELLDYDVETRSSFGTEFEDQVENELEKCTISGLNFDVAESLIENHSSSFGTLFEDQVENELDKCTISGFNFGEAESLIENRPSSFGTVFKVQVENELDNCIISGLNVDEAESLIGNHPSITTLQGFNNYQPLIDYISQQDQLFDFSSSNLSWPNEDDFYGTDNTFRQSNVENSNMTGLLTFEKETTSTSPESAADRVIVDYINDNRNESHQSEIWESTKPAVLSFGGIFTNSNKDIVDTTIPTVPLHNEATKFNAKTTKTTKRKTTKKNNPSDISKAIFKRKLADANISQSILSKATKNTTEAVNDFLDTNKITEVKHHNKDVPSFIQRFCPTCDKIKEKRKQYTNDQCEDCGSQLCYKCLNCKEFSSPRYTSTYCHIYEFCKPASTYYCNGCDYKSTRRLYIRRHFEFKHMSLKNL